jgi:hypothetical protein
MLIDEKSFGGIQALTWLPIDYARRWRRWSCKTLQAACPKRRTSRHQRLRRNPIDNAGEVCPRYSPSMVNPSRVGLADTEMRWFVVPRVSTIGG